VAGLTADSVFGSDIPVLNYVGLSNTPANGEFFFGLTQDDPVNLVPLVNAVGLPGFFGAPAETVIGVFNANGFSNVQETVPQSSLPAALVDLQAATTAFGGPTLSLGGRPFGTTVQAVQFISAFQGAFGWDTSSSEAAFGDPEFLATLNHVEDAFGDLTDQAYGPGAVGSIGIGDTPSEALAFVADNTSVFGTDTEFGGNDVIHGRGGNDVVVDLEGNNTVYTKEGNDTVYLGPGNDRVFDQGGDNTIIDLGGDNNITLMGTTSFATPEVGTDRVTTGDGNDNINAFDGRNFIDAGDGNNTVRGGHEYDEFKVGNGDDFVDVRGAFLNEDSYSEDLNGNGVQDPGENDTNGNGTFDLANNGVIDLGEDGNFNGVLDPDDSEVFAVLNIGQGFAAHNYIADSGGSDNLRASGNDEGDDLVLSDVIVEEDKVSFPGFRALTLSQSGNPGDDIIDLGKGDNLVIDGGGDNTVNTLTGDDRIITSFFSTGDDNIHSGAGKDTIQPGSGEDTVTGGAGGDIINLSGMNNPNAGDGDTDTLVYTSLADLSVSTSDLAEFFEGGGIDKIDVSALDKDGDGIGDITGIGPGGLGFLVGNFDGESDGNDFLVGWDFGGLPGFELGVDPIIVVLEEVSGGLTLDNFEFA
jgi:Ca2+-binding RTX toxin-like protein